MLTFNHDIYSEFMINVMRSLEIYYIPKDFMITAELDECNQIIFVMTGRYNVGYEINKKRYYRKQFGHSTLIGHYNVCFNTRHQFIMQAHTEMVSYIIRKKQWFTIMNKYKDFYGIIRQKSI
jgi:hypothetical protein